MKQIRLHGRGGQGVVTAAEIIAIAAFLDGKEAQAFPFFGVERTGAPIEAYARIADEAIIIREQIYEPNVIIILDETLLKNKDIFRGAKKDTLVIINTEKNKKELNLPLKNIATVAASKIAKEILGRDIVNTIILGAFVSAGKLISKEALEKAIEEKFQEKGKSTVEKNLKAVRAAFEITNL